MDKMSEENDFMQRSFFKGDFLQSAEWRKFQEIVGRKTYFVENEGYSASLVEHNLPIVGKYLYSPRGPKMGTSDKGQVTSLMRELIDLAKKKNAGWIRIEPENEEILNLIKENIIVKVVKAPYDVQPKEIFVIDISKSEEQLLGEMKSKTRYNIRLAEKHAVVTSNSSLVTSNKEKCMEEFLRLTKEMAQRHGIVAHPDQYYRKMIEIFPEEMLKIYLAEYAGKIVAANLVLFFGETATYLHGASSSENRNVMAPFLLQWQAILDAKKAGFKFYDFGGVKTQHTAYDKQKTNSLEGVTQFKLGFSPETKPVVFPGSYDIIVNHRAYALYKGLQRAKAFLHKIRR